MTLCEQVKCKHLTHKREKREQGCELLQWTVGWTSMVMPYNLMDYVDHILKTNNISSLMHLTDKCPHHQKLKLIYKLKQIGESK